MEWVVVTEWLLAAEVRWQVAVAAVAGWREPEARWVLVAADISLIESVFCVRLLLFYPTI